jgi:hypothetical protein
MHTLRMNHSGIKVPALQQLRLTALKAALNYYHLLLLVGGFCALQTAYFFGLSLQRDFNLERSILAVENRVSLDLPRLSLPNPALNLAGNPAQIREYLQNVNALLAGKNLSVRVSSLQQFTLQPASAVDASESDPANEGFSNCALEASHRHTFIERQLQLPGQTIRLKLAICQPTWWQSVSLYPLLASLLLVFLLSPYLPRRSFASVNGFGPGSGPDSGAAAGADAALSKEQSISLVLDLEHKCIALRGTDHKVELANKPLCFYAALLNYCQQHPQVRLCQHTILPDELLTMANQYFMRLVALGHVIRKRPDFDANMEKMLSEIRAALDELFIEYPESKTLFYPPKALGEGSRSKMHNFALNRLRDADWDIKGK